MGTIYRHNITSDELRRLSKMTPGRKIVDEENYEKKFNLDLIYADLFRLYSLRGKEKEAQLYFNKIKDKTLKFLLQ